MTTIDDPLPDLKGKTVPIVEIPQGTTLYRSHSLRYGPIFFGKKKLHRFDDPHGKYGVLYVAREPAGAFVETFLRFPAPTLIGRSDLDSSGCANIEAMREMRFVPLHSHYMVPLGVTAQVAHGPASAYDLSRLWSRAIYEHATDVDGIEYRSRHDDSLICLAIFDRAEDALRVTLASPSWTAPSTRLAPLLDKYKVDLM